MYVKHKKKKESPTYFLLLSYSYYMLVLYYARTEVSKLRVQQIFDGSRNKFKITLFMFIKKKKKILYQFLIFIVKLYFRS